MSIQIFTDKNGLLGKREIFKSSYMPGIPIAEIMNEPITASFLGFGVALTGASCYMLNQMKKTERAALLKDVFSKEGLNLSVGRLSVGSSDYSAELYSYDDVPFDTSLEHFSVERDEKYIIPMIKEILKINPNMYLYASPWSPPGWMKTGGSMCGGFMREEFIDCYADYIIKFIKAYENHGIKISALTPQNEIETDQQGRMPACLWHPETEVKFIEILHNKLKENGLDVKIWMHDHNFSMISRVLWSLEQNNNLQSCCDGIAFHYYDGSIEQTKILKEKYPNMSLHFTEGGPRLYDNYSTDWAKWGIMISRAFACNYSSFTGWNLLLDETGSPNIGPFSCGGLITKNSLTGELTYSGQYKAFKHIAPYITADSKVYPITCNTSRSCLFAYPKTETHTEGFLIRNGETLILVLINPKSEKQQIQFLLKGEWRYAELTPESISTVII